MYMLKSGKMEKKDLPGLETCLMCLEPLVVVIVRWEGFKKE
jgi:hypothetical protein